MTYASAVGVVDVAVPGAVAVLPAGHPAVGVVVVDLRGAGGVDHLGQSPPLVVAEPGDQHTRVLLRVEHPQRGDPTRLGPQAHPVAAGVAHLLGAPSSS